MTIDRTIFIFNLMQRQLTTLFCLLLVILSVVPLWAEEEEDHYMPPDSAQVSEQQSVDSTEKTATVETEKQDRRQPTVWSILFSGKYLAFLIVCAVGFSLLMGRWVNYWVRIGMLIVAVILFGIDSVYPMHPSPMCATTKLFMFKFTWGQFFPTFIAMFLAIFIPSLIGRKLFCGWVCPLGAIQDLINKIPFKYKFKQFNFGAFNTLRMGLFILFFLTTFAVIDHIAWLAKSVGADVTGDSWVAFSAYNVYEPVNLFELLHWSIDTHFIVMFSLLFIASLMLYRPFCYAVCPIGALSWLFEKIAPGRVRVDQEACTECMECIEVAPCPTMKKLVEGKNWSAPDCTSCGECLKVCEFDAIKFGFKK